MALQTDGVRCLPFSEFRSFVYIRLVGPLDEESARYERLLYLHRSTHSQKSADIHLCPEWDWNPRS
jgi:hypothetical protein